MPIPTTVGSDISTPVHNPHIECPEFDQPAATVGGSSDIGSVEPIAAIFPDPDDLGSAAEAPATAAGPDHLNSACQSAATDAGSKTEPLVCLGSLRSPNHRLWISGKLEEGLAGTLERKRGHASFVCNWIDGAGFISTELKWIIFSFSDLPSGFGVFG